MDEIDKTRIIMEGGCLYPAAHYAALSVFVSA